MPTTLPGFLTGYRPAGHFKTYVGDGQKLIEGESRKCIHCGYVWTYKPGSGTERGYCTRHDGFLCARPECARTQKRWLKEMNSSWSCVAFYDYNRWKFEQLKHDPRYVLQPSGVYTPVELT